MTTPSFRRLAPVLLLISLLAPLSAAQPPNSDPASTNPTNSAPTNGAPTNGAPTGGNPASDANDEAELLEQSIYIPYSRLRWVFEKEGRGVYLPYEKFQELWRAARAAQKPDADQRPPVAALITEAASEATIGEDVVRVAATLKLEVFEEGWSEIPLRLGDAAIRSAKVAGQPARIVPDGRNGYKLMLEKQGQDPEQFELELEYAKAFTKSPGQNSVSFQAPQAPVNRWRIRIPQPGVKVDIQPLLAATEAPADEGQFDAEQETVVLAFVGAAPQVRFQWTPKAEGATGLAALATVEAEHQMFVEEGVLRTRTSLKYEISRAELSQLLLEAPVDHKVTGVFDANVRQWEVAQENDLQKITVQLFQPALGAQSLVVESEKFLDNRAQQELSAPIVKAVDAGRQQGVVVVRLGSGLRAEATRSTGLLQLDATELPASLSRSQWNFSYRYSALPFDLGLEVEKVQPRIRTTELVEAYLEPEQLTLDLMVIFHVEQAGVFELQIDIPSGYQVLQVTGRAANNVEPVAVDSHQQLGDNGEQLQVNLSRKAFGPVGLFVELQKRLEDPNLLTPTGEISEIDLPVPRAATEAIERADGRLVVYAPESLRVNLGRQEGLRSVALGQAMSGVTSVRDGRFPGLSQRMALVYARQDVDVSLSAERRKPYITAAQLLSAQIDSGVVKYVATFDYDIRYSGVKQLRIDVPQTLASEIRNQTAGLREKTADPQPDDVAEDYVTWLLTGETELLGSVSVRFAWEQKLDELAVGKSVDVSLPVLNPMEVDRAWGQIVIGKGESLDVLPSDDSEGLRPIDPQQDLMRRQATGDAALAFEFHDAWSLTITATRYQMEEVKHTSIERALIRMVVVRRTENSPRRTAVQALYRVRSARQRLSVRLPDNVNRAEGFDTDPLRINGRVVPLEIGDQDDYSIPLVGQNPEEPFLVELRYTMDGDERSLDLPVFPNEPAVQKVYVSAYLPEELVLLGYRGPWSRESRGVRDVQMLDWVREDINVQESPDFPVDGRAYMFSTLRPSPDGNLRLVAFNENGLNGLVFGIVAFVGLLLVRRPLAQRLIAAGVLVSLLILAGVFLPTFASSLLGGALAAAVFLVVTLWFIASFVKFLARQNQARAERAARRAAAANANPPPASASEPANPETGESAEDSAAESSAPNDSPAAENPSESDDSQDDSSKGGRSDA